MQILLTNDDGIFAPGLAAMEKALARLGNVTVCAPATEQSGVGHSITFLTPLVVKEIVEGNRRRWAVDGSPADSVKIGIAEYCPQRPDLVVSGINGGLNSGINVLYSGTVAAAVEGAFFGITSVAVSLEWDERFQFEKAADIALAVIEKILANQGNRPTLYNLNIPTAALGKPPHVKVVPMAVQQYGEKYEKRTDPRGRNYYWAMGGPPTSIGDEATDLSELEKGFITLTPLHFDLTRHNFIAPMQKWNWI
ncbi:MAG TPA: 5'/3'-nucleotidase SurE [Pirellulales bacterium]|nr:5'/3'-nucleotidase SurE [Pirellulales bacterium]